MLNLDLFKTRYAEYLRMLNRSPVTISNYLWHLGKFSDYLNKVFVNDLQEITSRHVLDYQKEVFYHQTKHKQPYCPQAQNNHLKVIKSWFKFLKENGYLSYDPSKEAAYAKEPESLPKVILSPKEVNKILSQPDTTTTLGYRDKTLLEVLYSSGIRRDELRNIKIQDVDYVQGYLRINSGKGNKDRVLPLGKICCKYLEGWLLQLRPQWLNSGKSGHLFLSKKGRQMSKNALGKLIDRYVRSANIAKRATPHTFRHSFATHLIRNRANLRHVQEMLGHKSLASTQVYLHLAAADLKEALRKYHPRERNKG